MALVLRVIICAALLSLLLASRSLAQDEELLVLSCSYPTILTQPTVCTAAGPVAESATSFSWDWDDGSPPSDTQQSTHVYTRAGAYKVRLTAVSPDGQSHQSMILLDAVKLKLSLKASSFRRSRLLREGLKLSIARAPAQEKIRLILEAGVVRQRFMVTSDYAGAANPTIRLSKALRKALMDNATLTVKASSDLSTGEITGTLR